MSNPLKLKIAYLYPDILHGFCDRANIDAFVTRAGWRDVGVQVFEINSNDKIQATKFDFYYIFLSKYTINCALCQVFCIFL